MRIAVIAANGRSGKAFVELALSAGHSVKAGIRGASSLATHPNLTVQKCDATDINQVKELLKDQDAVASFIGHVKNSPANVQTDAIKTVIEVMKTNNLKRIISLTGTGVRFEGDKITLLDRFLNLSIALIDPKRIKDGKKHVDELKNSNLDWTIIRVLKLQNIKPAPFKLLANGPTKPFVGREEVAQAVLEVLEQNSFIRQAPIISKAEYLILSQSSVV